MAAWRRREALRRTALRRPDLLEAAPLDDEDRVALAELRDAVDASEGRRSDGDSDADGKA